MTVHPEIRTKGSLCTGHGAFDAALPGLPIWFAETNESASEVLRRNVPAVPNLGDIAAEDFTSRALTPDLITSGDPCQSLSSAGRRKGADDPRFLWPHVIDIIDRLRPREVFLENVGTLISARLRPGDTSWAGRKGSVLRLRLEDLRSAGYESRWAIVGACAVGAPHCRHRWFLRAQYVGRGASPGTQVTGPTCPARGTVNLLPTPRARDGKAGASPIGPRPNWHGGVDLPTALQKLLPTPNSYDWKAPQPSAFWRAAGRQVNLRDALFSVESETPTLNPPADSPWGAFTAAIARWEAVLGRPAPAPSTVGPKGGWRINPAFCEWMMGLPEGHIASVQPHQDAISLGGNGCVPLQGEYAFRLLDHSRPDCFLQGGLI